ncbi:TetR/AcrR family transcriptional regulator [Gordonia hirsuta]|uniref:TetR/AcrR family transcriptional regulator n=1 Tax=Gordonia hirsuta TaxID=53427 RepID=UPI0003480AF0|nr:TetR/AcrR family transcriptional regulator [Gordonia hirsuta]
MSRPSGNTAKPGRAPGRPKASEGLDTRADLIKVSRELFAAQGYAGTSVSEIGPRAGVSVPVLYQRFGNKAGLFVAVAEDVYGLGITRLNEAIDGITDFDEAVSAALREFAGLYAMDPSLAAMVVTVLVEAERNEELGPRLRPMLRELRQFADRLAALAPAERLNGDEGRRDLSRSLVAVMSGLMVSSMSMNRAEDYERLVEATRRLLVSR